MSSVASADIHRLASALRESAGDSEITTHNVLVHSANYIKADMEARVPVRTGRLRQSIEVKVFTDRVVIGPDTEYAAYVEFGTKPHVIRPRNKKALSFYVGGQRIVVTKVNHPGTKAQPYVRPAFEAWVDTLGTLVAEANVKRLEEAYR
jgi:HK97 gp10 family phage protein